MAAKKQSSGSRTSGNTAKKSSTAKSGGSAAARKTSSGKKTTGSKRTKTTNNISESIWFRYRDEIILLGALVLSVLLLLSNFHLCGPVGEFINQAVFGLFGFLAYLFPVLLFFGVAFYLSNKYNRIVIHKLISTVLLFVVMAALLQMVTYGNSAEFQLGELFRQSAEGKDGGGVIGGGLAKLLCMAVDVVGSFIVLIGLTALLLMFITEKLLFAFMGRKYQEQRLLMRERREQRAIAMEEARAAAIAGLPEDQVTFGGRRKKPRSYTFPREEKAAETVEMREVKPKKEKPVEEPVPELNTDTFHVNVSGLFKETPEEETPYYEKELQEKFRTPEAKTPVSQPMEDLGVSMYDPIEPVDAPVEAVDPLAVLDPIEAEKARILEAKTISGSKPLDSYAKTPPVEEAVYQKEAAAAKEAGAEVVDIPAIKPVVKPYVFPPIDLLARPKSSQSGTSTRELQETALTLQKTLDSFGVKVSVTNVSCGPAVTRYELQPERGVKVSRITGLADDIKLNLAAEDIRIEAPIPGKAAVGIEVPNKENSTVYLRELLESRNFKDHKSNVAFAVGKDIGGQTVVTDIAKMPHLLIAGATGSGKSVCINTLIMSILYKADPNDVKLIMIDPKVVELSVYNGIPHLLIPVVTEPKKASGALNWAVMEMTERYQRFADLGVRDIKGYNEKIATVAELKEDPKYVKMPQIVIIVDELADLMMVAPGEVEDAICRLAQLARAAGLHLIIATQRPSVNVITGLIKANIPSRIAFSVSSGIDSRTILDMVGAEKLLGKGDMLFFPTGMPKPVRVQGAFVSDTEVSSVVEFLTKQNEGGYNHEIIEKVANAQPAPVTNGGDAAFGNPNGQDEYFAEAGKFIIEKDKASIGMLQRVYKIGFNRAARIMDQLSEAGVVGPEEGTKPRKILMTLEQFENYLEQNG